MEDAKPEYVIPTPPKETPTSHTRYRFDLASGKLLRQQIPSDPNLNITEKEAQPAEYESALKQMQEETKRIAEALEKLKR